RLPTPRPRRRTSACISTASLATAPPRRRGDLKISSTCCLLTFPPFVLGADLHEVESRTMENVMPSTDQPAAVSTTARWAGRIVSGLLIAFLIFDAALKLTNLPIVAETMAQLGWPAHLSVVLGILTLIITVLYAVPRTSVLGAILLT